MRTTRKPQEPRTTFPKIRGIWNGGTYSHKTSCHKVCTCVHGKMMPCMEVRLAGKYILYIYVTHCRRACQECSQPSTMFTGGSRIAVKDHVRVKMYLTVQRRAGVNEWVEALINMCIVWHFSESCMTQLCWSAPMHMCRHWKLQAQNRLWNLSWETSCSYVNANGRGCMHWRSAAMQHVWQFKEIREVMAHDSLLMGPVGSFETLAGEMRI